MAKWAGFRFGEDIVNKLVLVTSGVHMRRATLYFSHFNNNFTSVRSDYITAKLSVFPL
ncbi:MAG: YdcF family protein [Psychromonas sp.]|nr:YdcF family protein [Psychromonas sp.]